MRRATITGWGKCVPPAVLTNADLEPMTDTTDDWITTRTGIKERRISHVDNSKMAVVAGRHALAAAGLRAEDVDMLIVATFSPDRLIPSSAALVQAELGALNAGVMDLNAVCSGFVYGLAVANGLIASRAAGTVLLIGSDKVSVVLDMDDRSTAVLFGDGAGAVVLEASEGSDGVLSSTLGADGSLANILTVTGFGTEDNVPRRLSRKLYMDGREVFRNAVTQMGDAAGKAVAGAGLELGDVDLLIAHQANIRIIDATARRLNLAPEKVFTNIDSYGNTSAASIPIALDEALEQDRIGPGGNVVFVAFGGGLTWAAAVVKWGERTTRIGVSDAALPPTDLTGKEPIEIRQAELRTRRGE